MIQLHTIPPVDWSAGLAKRIADLVADQQFAQAGIWRLRHVRVDLPTALALAPKAQHAPLCDWFRAQGLAYLLTGARRGDVLIALDFKKVRQV